MRDESAHSLDPMSIDPMSIDPRAVRRAFARAAPTYDAAAALPDEVRQRLIERLEVIKRVPNVILDLGAGTGRGSRQLKSRYPHARIVALDHALTMLLQSRRHQSWWRKFDTVCADAAALPLKAESIDWCISNLMLPWCEPLTVFSEARRVLNTGGLLSFTAFGPDTLQELRAAWSRVDSTPRVHRFIDMHDLGDALVHSGFAEPVMDVERIALTYDAPEKLLRELKAMGFVTATRGRIRHLGARKMLRELVNAYELLRIDGRIHATFEVIYGHAWRADADRIRTKDGETRIPVTSIQRR